jgi:CPA2 family monovalent cation:H+ antiporter-2
VETSSFLGDLLILFGVAVVVSYTFRLLHLSTIAGFLVAGALIGPFGLGLIASVTDVEVMAEIGVQHIFDLAPSRKDSAPEFL